MSSFSPPPRAKVLVTGGSGYIGSHTTLCLLEADFDVVVVDSEVNSSVESLVRVRSYLDRENGKKGLPPVGDRLVFLKADLCDVGWEEQLDRHAPFASCIHFAGLKAVGESVQLPIRYYQNNLISLFNVLNYLTRVGCGSIVFSSSATVYGVRVHIDIYIYIDNTIIL